MAQAYIDVLYLKDGSIIRGQVLEQTPDKSVKIQAYDGSIFVYNMDQVEKIVKETISNRSKVPVRDRNGNKKDNKSSLRGYKGFVDVGYSAGVGDWGEDRFEVSTAHGYQFNNFFFIGGGAGLHYYTDSEYFGVPIFANFRANFTKTKIAPFGDVKVGYSIGDFNGTYGSLAIGVRFTLKAKKALHLSLGYSNQGVEYDYYSSSYYYYSEENSTAITLKFGFEF